MNWITVIWLMNAGAFLTLAAFAARLESALLGDHDWCCIAMFYAAFFDQTHYAGARANLTKVAAVLDSKVRKLLGIK